MGYVVLPVENDKVYATAKEAKQKALEAAIDGKVYVVAKVVGVTKSNPVFVKYKEARLPDISTDIPISAKCDFDGKPAVASKIAATGDTVFLCLDCLGEEHGEK